MLGNSKPKQRQSETVKNRIQKYFQYNYRNISPGQSPHSSKINFLKTGSPQLLQQSGPQFQKGIILNIQNQRKKNLSAIVQPERSNNKVRYSQNSDHQNNNVTYLGQINAFERKKRGRHYYLRKKQDYQESYKIGILTKNGFEEQEANKVNLSQSTQPAVILNAQKQQNEQIGVEQLHYEMVIMQQRCKKIANN